MESNLEKSDLTQCPVCFEPYTEIGDHIPRILPCHCTLCQTCIEKLIQNQQLECPQDRTKHPARQEEKSFPQNKYILSFLRKEFQPKETDYDVCPEHNENMMLFCKDEKCQKTICAKCMSKNHLTHLVVNVLEEEKKKLNTKLESLLAALNSYTEELQRAEIQVEKEYENLLKEFTARKAKNLAELKEKLSNVADNMATLLDMKDKIEKGSTHQELMDKMEFMNVMKDLCAEAKEPVKVKFQELIECEEELEKAEKEDGEIDDALEENLRKRKKRSLYIIEAKELFSVKSSSHLRNIEVLSDGDVVEVDNSQLTRYDRGTGEVLYTTELKNWAGGMVEVNLGGKPTLAVSYNHTVSTPTASTGAVSAPAVSTGVDSTGTVSYNPAGSTEPSSKWAFSKWAGSTGVDSTGTVSYNPAGSTGAGSKWASSTRACSTGAGSTWVDSTRACSTRAGSTRVDSTRACSTRAGSTRAGSTWVDSTRACSTRAGSTGACSTRAGSTWVDSTRACSTRAGSTGADTLDRRIPRHKTITGLKLFDTPNMYKSTAVDVLETNTSLEKMCRFSDSRILGQSGTKRKNLKLINCETETPQLELVMMSLNKDSELKDMCVTKDTKGQEILICTYGEDLHVENLKGKALWSIGGAIGGKNPLKCISLTCDQRGHIFVCDDNNNCVDIFSIDGLYLGTLVSKGERGIGDPRRVRWCEKTSSLVVVHRVKNTRKVSALKIHYNSGSFS